ncbi:MAG: D-alanyl-D-alanine carboxypeptidase/D-alanyl-D-alanine-endopeptidase [Cyanobacteriota bacterium]|nr:D-alanyl-D-alanine carboxypeptidase/D-alanyl-D-alanine-endopeptidase [Cyanobacteriota bacterium]
MVKLIGLGLGLATAGLVGLVSPGAGQAALCEADLAPRLEAMLDQPPLDRAYVGMLLQTQASPGQPQRTLYSHQGDRRFTPASSLKLLTTATALDRLGPDYRIRTSVYGQPAADGATELRLVGRGDPTLGPPQIEQLAAQLAAAGVTRVSRWILDDGYFPGPALNPTWEWEDLQFDYATPVNGLIFNHNTLTLVITPGSIDQPLHLEWPGPDPSPDWPLVNQTTTVATGLEPQPLILIRQLGNPGLTLQGSLPMGAEPHQLDLAVLDPSQRFQQALALALQAKGVAVAAPVSRQVAGPVALEMELAHLLSPPLRDWLGAANRDSHNLTAEVLLKTLGVTQAPPGRTDASQTGIQVVKTTLASLGVDTSPLYLVDGSGLSRHNLVTPRALVETLQVMAQHPQAKVFRDSLAIAGVSGTLRHRFHQGPLTGHLQGKSGALTGNVALAGYLQPPHYPPLVVTVLINHAQEPAAQLRRRLDEILEWVAQLSQGC